MKSLVLGFGVLVLGFGGLVHFCRFGVLVLGFGGLVHFCRSPASPKSPKVAQSDPLEGPSGEGPLEGVLWKDPLGVRGFCRARLERRLGFGVWKLGFEDLAGGPTRGSTGRG